MSTFLGVFLQFLPWPLPERQATVLWPPIKGVTDHLTEQTRTDMSAKSATGVEEYNFS